MILISILLNANVIGHFIVWHHERGHAFVKILVCFIFRIKNVGDKSWLTEIIFKNSERQEIWYVTHALLRNDIVFWQGFVVSFKHWLIRLNSY